MATPVEVPKLGNTVEECLVAKWRKQKGDPVAPGDVVADIETDKSTFELPAPVGGTLLETFFDEGAVVPVLTNLCVIGAPGEDIEVYRPKSAGAAAGAAPEASTAASPAPPASPARASSPALSPRASRFAREHGIDPASVQGTGPGGRVLEADLRRAQAAPDFPPAAGHSPSRATGIRGRIAGRMREALASTAQYTLHASADAGGLLRLRARAKTADGPDVTLTDLVIFCAIRALDEMPDLNAAWRDGQIEQQPGISIGFACDTPRGLLVPVVRDAGRLTLGELAARLEDLAARARSGAISPDDLAGATFTVSNLGGLGIEAFTPILTPPQVAILGIGAIGPKPVRRAGQIEFIDALALSLTCDHQAIDGAPGARFLAVLRARIEAVESLCRLKS